MSTSFLESVKQAFASVFRHADIEALFLDEWTFADEVEPEVREALRQRPGYAKPIRNRKPTPMPPDVQTRPMPEATASLTLPPDDMSCFDGCEDAEEAAGPAAPSPPPPVRLRESKITVGKPFPVQEPDEDDHDLFAGLALGLHDPYPAGLDLDEGAPERMDTLDVTGGFVSAGAEAVEFRLSGPVGGGSPPDPVPIQLEPPPAPVPIELVSPAPPPPIPLRQAPTPPNLRDSVSSSFGATASSSASRRPKARTSRDNGTPPASIWDERRLRDDIVADLEEERDRSEDGNHRRVIAALSRQVDQEPLGLPPFPEAARKLLGQDGRLPTDEEVVEIVHSEPTLAGNVVKLANSPFYMAATHVASVQSAVMRIGLDQVRRVALAAVVGTSYEVKGFSRRIARIRLHSFAAALAAETLAQGTNLPPAEAFLAGLLHDAGEVLAYYLVRTATEQAQEGSNQFEPDRRQFDVLSRRYHPRLGALFLGGWDLPASVASAMAYHHHPDHAEPRFTEICALVHVADELAYRAVAHASASDWRAAMALRQPGATRAELDRATETDGIDGIDVDDLLFQAPRGTKRDRLHGIIRGTLLRLDSSDQASLDRSDALASTTL
jgi:HD-like signal output (HDOD) protein